MIITALISVISVACGLWLSANYDVPGGPGIVLVMSLIAGISVAVAALRT